MSTSTTRHKVADVMLSPERFAVVREKTFLKATLAEMTRCKLGIACVVDDEGKLVGIFTDGDVRRMLLRDQKPFSALFADDIVRHVTRHPATVRHDATLESAIALMEKKQIWDLPVVNGEQKLVGLLHLHPAIKAVLGL